MSDQLPPQVIAPAPQRPRRHIVLSIIMFLCGFILLLPGTCALLFLSLGGLGRDSSLMALWVVCFAISAGGIVLLVKTFR